MGLFRTDKPLPMHRHCLSVQRPAERIFASSDPARPPNLAGSADISKGAGEVPAGSLPVRPVN